ncbi:MAG: porin [Gemmataceae bacterium]
MLRVALTSLIVSLAGFPPTFAEPPLVPESAPPITTPADPPSTQTAESRKDAKGKDEKGKDEKDKDEKGKDEKGKDEKREGDKAKKDGSKDESKEKDDSKESALSPLEKFLKPSFRIRGLIESEAVMAAQSAQSKATIGDLQNGYGFRRVRLGAQGNIGDSSRWVSELEFVGGGVQLLDVFVGLTAIPYVREIRVGHFREPFSLEGATGVPFVTFLERSPLNELDPARNWGVAGYWWPENERTEFALGVYRNGTTNGGQSLGDEDTWSYTARLTGLPIYNPDDCAFRLLHLGMALSYRNPSNGVVVFNPGTPPSLLAVVDNPDTPFLPSVIIPANSQQLYNLQAAYVDGPFSLQSEWFATAIQQTNAGVGFIHGLYLQVSYFLTGEHRGYDLTRGSFGQVKVLRPMIRSLEYSGSGYGALELAARYSYFDFSSPNLPLANDGSSSRAILNQLELGVNWYLNSYTRLIFNYTLPVVDRLNRDTTSAHVFGLRAAIYW